MINQAVEIKRQSTFTPPYCPNPRCIHHQKGEHFYYKNGWLKTQKFPYVNQRYRCKDCGTQFSYNTFSLEYRCRQIGLMDQIHFCVLNSMGHSSTARKLKISEHTVRSRIAELARQGLLLEKTFEQKVSVNEPIVYDGFESFSHDQYSPHYINTAVGAKSLYIYKTTFSPLNRKGRMTDKQREKNTLLIQQYGKYPSDSIRRETTSILQELCDKSVGRELILHTDEHKSYVLSVQKDLGKCNIVHYTTNSKLPRTTLNPLFPVNHLHRNYRHFLAAHRRETIAFQQNEAATMDKITIHRLYRNFMTPRLFRKKKSPTPAMLKGLSSKLLSFSELYPFRRLKTQFCLDERDDKQFHRVWDFSRQKITRY